MSKLNVLMIPTTNSGVAYWRLYNYWTGLYRNNIANCKMLWWRKDITRDPHPWEQMLEDPIAQYRISAEMGAYAREADIIIIQAVHSRTSLSMFYALKDMCPNTPIVTEMDDDITWTPSEHPASVHFHPFSDIVHVMLTQLKYSDGLIVSTPWLKEVYSEHNKNIAVALNCIDINTWGSVNPTNRCGIRVGWSGGSSHVEDLRLIEPAVRQLSEKYKDIKFVFMHCCPDFLRGIKGVVPVSKWTRIDKYPKAIAHQDFDIGVAPLVDNLFNRCKSNLRWLEYSALGIPTVASNVGHFKQTIHNGEDGILVDDPSEFGPAIQRLIDDAGARKSMGMKANGRVKTDFNLDVLSHEYVENLENFVKAGVCSHPPPVMDSEEIKALVPTESKEEQLIDRGQLEVEI